MKTLTFYGCALNPAGRIGQQLVTRVQSAPGVRVTQSVEWTGVTYPNTRAGQKQANADMIAFNSAWESRVVGAYEAQA